MICESRISIVDNGWFACTLDQDLRIFDAKKALLSFVESQCQFVKKEWEKRYIFFDSGNIF